jgi:hypothetical protein
MLNNLKEQFEYWTEKRIDNEFYQGLPTLSDRNMKYAIERTDTGFYIIQRDSATYFNLLTGVVYRIDCRWNEIDLKCNDDLYRRSTNSNEFLVDKPLESKFIEINGKTHWYSVVERPMNNLGIDCNIDISNKLITESYIKEWIDQTTIVLRHIKEVVKQNNAGYPANGVLLTNRIRVADNTYSWKTFKRWQKGFDPAIDKTLSTLRDFQMSAGYLMHGGEITPELIELGSKQIAECQRYAREQWNTLNNQ